MEKKQLTELTLTDKEHSICEDCLNIIRELQSELNVNDYLEGQTEFITKSDLDVVNFVLNELRDTWNLYVIPKKEE